MINRDPGTGRVIPDVLQVLSAHQKVAERYDLEIFELALCGS